MSSVACGFTFLACLVGASFLRRTTINDILLSVFVAVLVHVSLLGAPDMAQDTKWFNQARAALDNPDPVTGALEAGQVCITWSASKNFTPDARYWSVVAEISKRLGSAEGIEFNQNNAIHSILEKGK